MGVGTGNQTVTPGGGWQPPSHSAFPGYTQEMAKLRDEQQALAKQQAELMERYSQIMADHYRRLSEDRMYATMVNELSAPDTTRWDTTVSEGFKALGQWDYILSMGSERLVR
jgi:hypothetical protein